MPDTLKPRDAKEVEDAVRWALGSEKPLEIAGQGTKRMIGRPSRPMSRIWTNAEPRVIACTPIIHRLVRLSNST